MANRRSYINKFWLACLK